MAEKMLSKDRRTIRARCVFLLGNALSEYWVLFLSIAYFLGMWCITPDLATHENLRNIFLNMLPLLVISIGQTIVLITGGIDLSVTSVVGLASVAGALVMNSDTGLLAARAWAAPVGIVVMLAVGFLAGACNGLAIARMRMPPFIVTLTTMMFLSGFAIWITKSRPIHNLPPGFNALGKGAFYSIPNPLFIALALSLGMHVLLSRTLMGRWMYAVGMNAKAALVSGVAVSWILVLAYTLSGICAAMASILYTGRLETGSPVMGQRMLLDVIGASVIGGTSLFGGHGKIIWTVFGVWFICLIDNSLNMLGLSYFVIMMVKGAVILLASLLDALRTRFLFAN